MRRMGGMVGPCNSQVCRGGSRSFATPDLWIPQELVATDFVDPGREDGTRVVVPRVAAHLFSVLRTVGTPLPSTEPRPEPHMSDSRIEK